MDFHAAALTILLLSQFLDVSGMRHLVYWDKKLIPSLSKDGLEITLEINDWMDVLCPYYESIDSKPRIAGRNEFLMIYNVTENDFKHCDTRRGLRLQVCDDPYSEKKLTTKFQERSPSPFGFTFRPGATYYYVSKPVHVASSHGCSANTLKMKINVKEKGAVFETDDPDATKVYHDHKGDKTSTQFHPKTTTAKPTAHTIKRHHHHERATKSLATSSTRPVFQIIGGGKSTPKFASAGKKSEQVQKDDPGNFGHASTHQSRIRSLILLLIPSAVAVALQRG